MLHPRRLETSSKLLVGEEVDPATQVSPPISLGVAVNLTEEMGTQTTSAAELDFYSGILHPGFQDSRQHPDWSEAHMLHYCLPSPLCLFHLEWLVTSLLVSETVSYACATG